MEIDAKPPQKLSFEETFSIFIIKGSGKIVRDIIKFLPNLTEDDSDDKHNIEILKIREDLYIKLAVDYVYY